MNPAYANYMPYNQQQYYGMGMPSPYQNGGMPSPGYHYPNYPRSPPAMHQYVPMMGVSVPPSYPRPSQQSPAILSTPYQPPPALVPIPPQTPSSTHSSQMIAPMTPPTPQSVDPPPDTPTTQSAVQDPVVEAKSKPFRPPLPWYSRSDVDFPKKTLRSKRRRKAPAENSEALSLPVQQHEASSGQVEETADGELRSTLPVSEHASTEPSTTNATVTTPTVSNARERSNTATSATPTKSSVAGGRPVHPALPVLPKTAVKSSAEKTHGEATNADVPAEAAATGASDEAAPEAPIGDAEDAAQPQIASPPPRQPPSSWANLFAKSAAAAAAGRDGASSSGDGNATGSADTADAGSSSTFPKTSNGSLAEAIRSYSVGRSEKVSFIEPRGLINTGNMCYMNSVLQVLVFCIPFYDFLIQVSQRAAHSFKSDTPLVDAMIMFLHEYNILKSAPSSDKLGRSLKSEDLEKYGEPFTPEFVYEAIRRLDRFASMRRGHQQDAEEFLGFLLQSLDDECTHLMANAPSTGATTPDGAPNAATADVSGDWLEVGRKQKAAVSRSSGTNSSTPITKIFGGLLRSEFRVPGLKDSITTEPYQPLQLDIGSPDVRNVVDALRGLTRPERLQGDFNSPRGKDVSATKQVFIETLPPVLILHLKRFQFDAEGNGTVKIWKKIGYPLDLEIPREALSRQKRNEDMPRYRLISVVYHHGKNASGGHYTVDVRRQDGQEWIRLDDTVIRRVRSEDVAEIGAEEEPKESRKELGSNGIAPSNRFGAINDDDTGDEEGGWNQVPNSHKRWSSVVNGATNGAAKGKPAKDNSKDNKVAYLLFYQRV